MRKKYAVIIAVAVLVVAVLIFVFESEALEVETATAQVGPIREMVEERGIVTLKTDYVVTMPVSGTLLEVKFEDGDRVEKGALVATVEDVEIRAALDGVKAQIESIEKQKTSVDVARPKDEEIEKARDAVRVADAELAAQAASIPALANAAETAEADYRDALAQHEEKFISDSDLRHARDAMLRARAALASQRQVVRAAEFSVKIRKTAREMILKYRDEGEYRREVMDAEIKALKAELASLENNLEKTKITAPVSGLVFNRTTRGKRVLQAGMEIMRIANNSEVEIRADILTDDLPGVEPGVKVEISGDRLGEKTIYGKVESVRPVGYTKPSTLGVEEQRIDVMISFDNSKLNLRPGVAVDVKILTMEKEDALHVPERAVFKKDGKKHVFRIENGKARIVEIKTGLENDDFNEVLKGLAEGDVVIVAPPLELEEGAEVTPMAGY